MQLDGAMGGVAAVQEMLLHDRRGTLYVFPAIPAGWGRVTFERMRAPGGFVVSGWRDGLTNWRIELTATRDGTLRIAPPSSTYRWIQGDRQGTGTGGLELPMQAGEGLTLLSDEALDEH
jgi:hypothetical protein